MPNTRRRRFSVQNDISGRDSSKMQNGMKSSHQTSYDTTTIVNLLQTRTSKSKNKMSPNSSKNSTNISVELENVNTVTMKNKSTVDKDITVTSSNIDLFNNLSIENSSTEQCINYPSPGESQGKVCEEKLENKDNTSARREKYPRQHRIKVRSPRRRLPIMEQKGTENIRRSLGTVTVDWEHEEGIINEVIHENNEQERLSDHSIEDMCRICHGGEPLSNELGQLISACSCRGTVGRIHVKCLERWLTESGKSRCELCGTRYATRRVHKYGLLRALLMWILSQNAKQLMVDSLGIMLMSPLAVLAAWLSGRTLAGLMTQDNQTTPWPLASTFVLACMTLFACDYVVIMAVASRPTRQAVCYYCWIVSAATRHALGWWIWYRSQYEVRLQLLETVE